MSWRAPIFFYVSRNRGAPFAVPAHVVYDTAGSGWVSVRLLAGRRKGEQISIDRSDFHRTPGNARLVPGSREAIAKHGPRELVAATEARALRKRIGSWRGRLTERQLRNAFDQVAQLAESVRPRTPSDRAWRYFDSDLEDWHAGHHTAALLIRMIDMVLGAAERYQPPPVDQHSAAYARAAALESEAHRLVLAIEGSAPEARWLEVADAFEVVEDAWREAGDDDQADDVRANRQKIVTTIKRAHASRRQR